MAPQAHLGASTRRAGLGLDHDRHCRIDDPGPENRGQPEDRSGRVAAGAGNVARLADLRAVQLRHAVDRVGDHIGQRVRPAVPGLVVLRIAEAEIGTQVDHDRTQLQQPLDLWRRRPMREAGKEEIDGLKLLGRDEAELGALAQVRMDGMDELPGPSPRGDLGNVHLRVTEQEPQQLTTGIARSTEYRDVECHRKIPYLLFRS